MSLRTRLLWVLAFAALLPSIVVGGQAIRRSRAAVEEQVMSDHLALIRALGGALDERLQAARRTMELAAASWADERTQDSVDTQMSRKRTARHLARLRDSEPMISALALFDVAGRQLAGDPISLDGDLGAGAFGGYIGDVQSVDGRQMVRAVTQARSRTGELVGVFVAELDLVFIRDTIRGARLGPSAVLLVVDAEGRLVASSGDAAGHRLLRPESPAVDRALASAEEGSLEADGRVFAYRNLAGFQSLRGVRWSLIHEQPTAEAYRVARDTASDTFVIAVLALCLAVFIGGVLATKITRPLQSLAERADAIAEGRAPGPPVVATGEVGHLAKRFDEMAARLEERENLRDALARRDRLASVGTMAAGVAHELNNPLTTILGYAALLREDKSDTHPDARPLALIESEALRLKRLTESVLGFARSESHAGHADVNQLVEQMRELMAPILRKEGVTLRISPGNRESLAHVDPYSVQQILHNLIKNAAQATGTGGVVEIETSAVSGRVEIAVTDNGPGLSDEAAQQMFEPFYTTKSAAEGSGLGLAICRHIAAQFSGTVEGMTRADGRGARFVVSLPLVEEA